MTKLELASLKRELKYLKNKINHDDFILVLKAIGVAFQNNIYFDLLIYLDVKESPDKIINWEKDLVDYVDKPRKIHARD